MAPPRIPMNLIMHGLRRRLHQSLHRLQRNPPSPPNTRDGRLAGASPMGRHGSRSSSEEEEQSDSDDPGYNPEESEEEDVEFSDDEPVDDPMDVDDSDEELATAQEMDDATFVPPPNFFTNNDISAELFPGDYWPKVPMPAESDLANLYVNRQGETGRAHLQRIYNAEKSYFNKLWKADLDTYKASISGLSRAERRARMARRKRHLVLLKGHAYPTFEEVIEVAEIYLLPRLQDPFPSENFGWTPAQVREMLPIVAHWSQVTGPGGHYHLITKSMLLNAFRLAFKNRGRPTDMPRPVSEIKLGDKDARVRIGVFDRDLPLSKAKREKGEAQIPARLKGAIAYLSMDYTFWFPSFKCKDFHNSIASFKYVERDPQFVDIIRRLIIACDEKIFEVYMAYNRKIFVYSLRAVTYRGCVGRQLTAAEQALMPRDVTTWQGLGMKAPAYRILMMYQCVRVFMDHAKDMMEMDRHMAQIEGHDFFKVSKRADRDFIRSMLSA